MAVGYERRVCGAPPQLDVVAGSSPTWSDLIGCKWVFTVKQRPNGSIDKYKARLVAKGFMQ